MKPRFISDLHLSEKHPELTQAFFTFLNESKEACTHLFILGDLFETWIGDDDINNFLDSTSVHQKRYKNEELQHLGDTIAVIQNDMQAQIDALSVKVTQWRSKDQKDMYRDRELLLEGMRNSSDKIKNIQIKQNLIRGSSFSKKSLINSALTSCNVVFPTDFAVTDLTLSVNNAISPKESPGTKVATIFSSLETICTLPDST